MTSDEIRAEVHAAIDDVTREARENRWLYEDWLKAALKAGFDSLIDAVLADRVEVSGDVSIQIPPIYAKLDTGEAAAG